MADLIQNLLPDALRQHQDSVWYAPNPQFAAMPLEQAWDIFLAAANTACPGFAIRPEHMQTYTDIFHWCLCDNLSPFNPAKGLWIYGNIGTGKSTMLSIVRQFCALCRQPWPTRYSTYGFHAINASALAGVYQSGGIAELSPYVESQRLAIDDLGAEPIPVSHFGDPLNVIQYLLQVRYDRRRSAFTHVTTNLSIEQISDLYGDRVADRVREMFNFVPLLGATHRDN